MTENSDDSPFSHFSNFIALFLLSVDYYSCSNTRKKTDISRHKLQNTVNSITFLIYCTTNMLLLLFYCYFLLFKSARSTQKYPSNPKANYFITILGKTKTYYVQSGHSSAISRKNKSIVMFKLIILNIFRSRFIKRLPNYMYTMVLHSVINWKSKTHDLHSSFVQPLSLIKFQVFNRKYVHILKEYKNATNIIVSIQSHASVVPMMLIYDRIIMFVKLHQLNTQECWYAGA